MTTSPPITVWLLVSPEQHARLAAELDHPAFQIVSEEPATGEVPVIDLVIWEPAATGRDVEATLEILPRPVLVLVLGKFSIGCVVPIDWLLPADAPAYEIARISLWLGEHVTLLRQLRTALRSRRRWRRRALTDSLTRLPNRRAWDRRVVEWMAAADTRQRALCIADLDGFKQVNDQWGHPCGDRVLQTVAAVLAPRGNDASGTSGNSDDRDFVARLGGDEFGLLLTTQGHADLSAKLARFHENLAQELSRQDLPPVTLTIGAVALTAEASGGSSISPLLQEADRALRQAKAAGGNCSRVLNWP